MFELTRMTENRRSLTNPDRPLWMLSLNYNSNARAIYKNLCSSQDATFELMDAVKLTRTAQSLADLSL